jgi:hypothetical protein
MKKREMTKTEQVEIEKWLNGDRVQGLMSTIETPNDGREEEEIFTDEEHNFAEKAFDETVEEMRYYEMSNFDFEESEQDKKDEFAIFFQEVIDLFETKIIEKKMTLNYNSEVFS